MTKLFDQFSIILGVLIGVVAALLIIKFMPRLKNKMSSTDHKPRTRSSSKSHEWTLRNHLLRKAQNLHLGSNYCPLSEIYIDQFLYGHPLHMDVNTLQEDEPAFFREALSIADVTELASEFPLPKFKLSQAVNLDRNMAITGGIGTGKTTCMANLSIEILEDRCPNATLNGYLPVYLHILQLFSVRQYTLDEILSRCLFEEGLELSPPEISEILTPYLSKSRLLLLLDGLDELRPDQFDKAVTLIRQLRKEYPEVNFIVSCGPYYTRGLASAGFGFSPIVPPGTSEQNYLLSAWTKAFTGNETEGLGRGANSAIIFSDLWMEQELLQPNYADITLHILSILFREIVPEQHPIIPYLERKTENLVGAEVLIQLAEEMIGSDQYALSAQQTNRVIGAAPGIPPLKSNEIMETLISHEVLIQFDDLIRFTCPAILCRLAALSKTYRPSTDVDILLHSPIDNATSLASSLPRDYIPDWIHILNPGNARILSLILDHIFSAVGQVPDLSTTFPKLAQAIVSEKIPLSTKLKISTIIYYTNPDLFSKFLLKLSTMPQINLLKLTAIYYGLSPLEKHLQYLADIINSPDFSLSLYGLQALLTSADSNAPRFLLQLISSNPEKLGRVTSELCSQYPINGYEVLRELMKEEDSNLRRFVVYGLRLVNEGWAKEQLLKMSKDDEVWMIRDLASQAMQNGYNSSKFAPHKLTPVFDHQVIIAAAGRRGLGSTPNQYPYYLLIDLLNNGSLNESILALQYLLEKLNDDAVQNIKHLTTFENPLREIATRALYELSLRV